MTLIIVSLAMNAALATSDRAPALPPEALADGVSDSGEAPAAVEATGEHPAAESATSTGATEPEAKGVTAPPTLFAGFLAQASQRRAASWVRRATVTGSLVAHAVLLLVGVVYSFWHVDELSTPRVAVSLLALPPAPPPPPPAARAARQAPKPRPRPTPVQQPVTVKPVQPETVEAATTADDAQAGEREGVEGGVTGGVAGAVLTAAPPPRLPQLSPQERQALIRRYLEDILRTRIASRLRLPAEAERLGVEGTVVLLLAIDGGGRLVGLRTAGTCPHEILCDAAARTVREAAPFPPPPAALGGGLQAELPLNYRLE